MYYIWTSLRCLYIIYTKMAELNTNFRSAVRDLIYMLERGYPKPPSIDLVGNRYSLNHVERMLLFRGVFDEKTCGKRRKKCVESNAVSASLLLIDGFNVLLTVESYLKGLLVFRSLDGFVRDVSEVYKSYRESKTTVHATDFLVWFIKKRSGKTALYFDATTAASSQCASLIAKRAEKTASCLDISIAKSVDHELLERSRSTSGVVVATSDTEILDRADTAIDIPHCIIEKKFDKTILDLGSFLEDRIR